MTAALNIDMDAANAAMSRTKITLMASRDVTFFVHCLLRLRHVWDHSIPAACTDGETVWYNPQFFMEYCNAEERIGLMLHETLHVIFAHMLRQAGLDPERWNAACDYVINLIIISRGFKLPKGGLYDTKYAGMHAEEVYKRLPQTIKLPWKDLRPAQCEQGDDPKRAEQTLQRKIDDMLVTAVIAARNAGDKAGSIPGEIELYVDSLLNPKVPWHRVLASLFTRLVRSGRSFRKPNRRYLDADFIMPSRYSVGIAHGACATDISGSVTDRQYHHYVSETAAILRNVRPQYIDFLQFDTRITRNDRITNVADLMNVTFHGRGGTRIEPVLRWAKAHAPDWLILFTDGHFDDLQTHPRCPVIWIIHGNKGFTAPFGRVIHITFDE